MKKSLLASYPCCTAAQQEARGPSGRQPSPEDQMKVQFLGAAQTVTGSCYMVEAAGKRFCIDCGMHQGNKAIEARNRETELYLSRAFAVAIRSRAAS